MRHSPIHLSNPALAPNLLLSSRQRKRPGKELSCHSAGADTMRPPAMSGQCLGNPRYFRVCFLATAATPPRLKNEHPVPNLSDVRHQVALANRMLANEGVLDAFGHVSMRHPADPGRYLLSRSRSPALIEADDILEFTLDSSRSSGRRRNSTPSG